jgi:hypothetical protein
MPCADFNANALYFDILNARPYQKRNLTQRYLKLLSVSDEPENIMAMTFTNKAVDEH